MTWFEEKKGFRTFSFIFNINIYVCYELLFLALIKSFALDYAVRINKLLSMYILVYVKLRVSVTKKKKKIIHVFYLFSCVAFTSL